MLVRLIGMDKNFHNRFKDSYTTNIIEFEKLTMLVKNCLIIFSLVIIMYFLHLLTFQTLIFMI